MKRQQTRFFIGLWLTILSGGAALSHQLLWTNRMTDLLGASAASTSRVFGCFFLGLAVGAGLMGWQVAKVKRPWRWLAYAEFSVAILCMPILFLSSWTDWIWPWLGVEGLLGWKGASIKWILSMSVVFLPATAMGTTLPLLIRGVQGNPRVDQTSSVWLYAFNTIGGLLGLVITGYFALYSLGINGTMLLAIGVNISVGAIALWVDRSAKLFHPILQSSKESNQGFLTILKQIGYKELITAFSSGSLILALEILAMDLVMLVAPISFHAPLVVLGAFILTLAISAACLPTLEKWFPTNSQYILIVLLATAILTSLGPIWFVKSAMNAEGMQTANSFFSFTRSLFFLVLLSFGPGIFMGGLVFPCLLKKMPKQCEKSATAGYLLSINGLGGLLGAEFAYGILLPILGVYQSVGIIALIYILIGFIWIKPVIGMKPGLKFAIGSGAAVAVIMSFSWLKSLPVVNPNMGLKVIDLEFGREGNLAVVEHQNFGRGLLFSNQYLLGSTNVRFDQERQAHIPLLLHKAPENVCFVGLATGITPSAALQHSTIKHIDVVELSSMVSRAADAHFSDFNANIMQAPNTDVSVEDGRTFIAAQQNKYDVIISDLFLPWRPGVGRLYSVEHFQSTKEALRSSGLYCHWLPLYQFTEDQLDLVIKTFQSVFPKTYLFEGKLQLDTPVLGLMGFKDSDLDWDLIQQACSRVRQTDNVKDPTVRHYQGLAMLYRGTSQTKKQPSDFNTLDNRKLELQAGLDRMVDPTGTKYLAGPNWLNYVQNHLKSNSLNNEKFKSISTLAAKGINISVLGAKGKQDPKTKNESLKKIFSLIPEEILKDRQSDWERWAGTEITVRWKQKEKATPPVKPRAIK